MFRKSIIAFGALALIIQPLGAQEVREAPDPARLKANVEKLVSFGTRHTLSSATDKKRGIGAARRWGAQEFGRYAKACGGCLLVETIGDTFTGPRAPNGVIVEDVLAIQKGTGDPNHVIIIAGHIDSRVTDVMNFTADAPGANDDGSGTALVLEAARILSKEKFDATIVYALLSGEEQGLWGGTLLAREATKRGWKVAAMLNNDIVGNTMGTDGRVVDKVVRVFSEGIESAKDKDGLLVQRGIGAEDDSPSRSLAKTARRVAEANPSIGLEAFLVRRPDRFSRGGDHIPFLAAGFPAIRFSVGVENYDAQHQDMRSENGRIYGDTVDRMDFAYLAKVTALNIAVIRELANVPASPATATITGALGSDTTVSWDAVPGAWGYRVRWRRTDTDRWEHHQDVRGTTSITIPKAVIDDNFFAVSTLSESGAESVPVFAGAAIRR